MCSEYKSFIRYMICSFSLRKGLGQSRGNGHGEGSSYLASDPAIHSFSASGMCGSGSASRLPRSEGPLAKPQEQEAHLATQSGHSFCPSPETTLTCPCWLSESLSGLGMLTQPNQAQREREREMSTNHGAVPQ